MRKALHPISQLIIKHLEGTANAQEKKELEVWIHADAANLELFEELSDEYRMSKDLVAYSEDKKATWAKIVAMAPELEEAPVKRINWMRYAAAAAILLIIGTGVWYFTANAPANDPIVQTNKGPYKNDIQAPASDRATLTLADGKIINLDAVQKGQLAEQGVMEVVKKEDGTIEYRKAEGGSGKSEVTYNTISTNRGSRYKVVLADNSTVWLNSASSLKYPTAFTGENRTVELTGEGYFEVAKSSGAGGKKRPFMVKVNGMQVEVLGTHFNIMGYTDESAIKTTLLEGSVRVTPVPVAGGGPVVRNSQLLSPGQQAILTGKANTLKVEEADTEEAIAWKNEIFVYNNASIETIMREVARSYDVEVVYAGERPTDKFNVMGVPRNVPVSQILKILELTDKIRFDVEGRRITVRKN
ncbi:DUF4974 domain-containing protein [Pseudoflavitalea sp. X16]|uniref:FecR family protein n=1 Tax=Paraflavitalea devenefica TaxID=2716334 RepID=UPI00142125B3|nr:FecR family protein [Paraflavitalea devenefica]NII29869.1 DUF4974 domain-containing protein [Paraflavitalea devenefica]